MPQHEHNKRMLVSNIRLL